MVYLAHIASDAQIMAQWGWLVPERYVPIFATAFGDLVLRSPEGSIFFLSTLDATLIQLARDESDLADALKDEALCEDLVMPALTRELVVQLGELRDGECFSVVIPPTLGGQLNVKNFHTLPLADHVAALGKLQAQVASDPPGTTYSRVILGG